MSLHVIPINDLKPHKECSTCECKPTLEEIDGEMMFVHNSYDGRELKEMTEQQNKALVKDCSKFASKFKSKEEFRKWCEEGTKKDLECTLKAFEESGAYEWCGVINEVLKGKGNEWR